MAFGSSSNFFDYCCTLYFEGKSILIFPTIIYGRHQMTELSLACCHTSGHWNEIHTFSLTSHKLKKLRMTYLL